MIRPINMADVDQLTRLCAEHADYEQLSFDSKGLTQRWPALIFGDDPKLFVWVCEEAGSLVGYMSATIDYATWTAAPFTYMDCLYLRESSRGRGLGQHFMNILIQFSASKGCSEIQWHTPPHNQLGIDFYCRIGAHEKEKRRFFLVGTT
jgi:ribosomal protein S18 acetylase RimI-like enzyme